MEDTLFGKNKLLISFFRRYFRFSLRRNFSLIHVKNLSSAIEAVKISNAEKRPLIFCANHSSWWDVPLIVFLTYDILKSDSYCLMEKRQFDVHPYFRGIGAVPIIREDPHNAARILGRCTDYLNGSGKSLWIFPQGEIIPNSRRPIRFYSGVSHLLEQLKEPLLVCTYMDFRFTGNQFPEAYVDFFRVNEKVSLEREERTSFTKGLAGEYEQAADEFDLAFSEGKVTGFEILMKGRKSVNDKSFTRFS